MNVRSTVPSLANPVQSRDLQTVLSLTPLARRIPVAAAFLGYPVATLCQEAGLSNKHRIYYRRVWRGRDDEDCAVPFRVMQALALVLGIPFHVLWDEEAIERPAAVVRGGILVSASLVEPHRRARGLRLVGNRSRKGQAS